MALDRRRKNVDWQIVDERGESYQVGSYVMPQVAVLMDIRDGLRELTTLLRGANLAAIPPILRTISRKVATPRPRKART
jgi:hypothetical protein